jgi:glycosyltransferase involved in cell wall biosynthesis
MTASTLFVMPSIREGFGMVVLEAMAASTPVIIARSKMNAALELVDHESTGLIVEPGNPDAIAEAMVRLLSDDKLYQRLARNGRSLAESLTWDDVASNLERVYTKLTASSRDSAA